jgi:hypothetical protein
MTDVFQVSLVWYRVPLGTHDQIFIYIRTNTATIVLCIGLCHMFGFLMLDINLNTV